LFTGGEGKTFHSGYDTSVEFGKPVIFTGGSIIPIVSVTSIYGRANRQPCVGGGGIILDPLAVVIVYQDKMEVCLIRHGNFFDNLSGLVNLASKFSS